MNAHEAKFTELVAGYPHLLFNDRDYSFHCMVCKEALVLDRKLIHACWQKGAEPMVKHIMEAHVTPWLNLHKECGDVRSLAV